jgi:hypothetical protein
MLGARGKLGLKGYVAIQDVVEVVGNAVSCNHFEGVKCVHELTMEGSDGSSMSAPIYYVVLAGSGQALCLGA